MQHNEPPRKKIEAIMKQTNDKILPKNHSTCTTNPMSVN